MPSILPLYEATRFVPGQVFTSAFLGEAFLRTKQLDDAQRTLEGGLELATRGGDRKFFIGWMRRLLAEIAMERDPEQLTEPFATPHFEKCIACFARSKRRTSSRWRMLRYGHLHRRQGRVDKAREYLGKALEIFERLGTLIEPNKITAELNQQ